MNLHRFVPQDDCFERLGRRDADETACELWWSGSGIRTVAACSTMTVEAEGPAGIHAAWLAVLLDDALVARFPLLPGVREYPVLAGMDPAFAHEVSILRDSQITGEDSIPLRLLSVSTDGVLRQPEPRQRLIEFIGDSLTVGEGAAGPQSGAEWRGVYVCSAAAFPHRVAEALHADKRLVALGGWGVWRSWDGKPECRIGAIYERLCPMIPAGDKPYDFSRERPADAIVINLGTNDGSAMKLVSDSERDDACAGLRQRIREMIAQLRRLHPGVPLLWAYGLCGVDPLVQAQLEAVCKAEGVTLVPLAPSATLGSRQHPSRAGHAVAAAEITEALRKLWAADA